MSGPDPREKTDHEHEDELLDEALDESFPASDPISLTRPHVNGHGTGD